MKKVTKTMLKVGGVLAAVDIADIIAKGQTLNLTETVNEETGEAMKEAMLAARPSLRAKMIIGVSNLFKKIYDSIE